MTHEIRSSLRSLFRAKGHSFLIVVTLALGIGATTSIFTVVRGVLLSPLPFSDPDRLVMLWQRAPGVGVAEDWFSTTQYFDMREQVAGFEELAIFFGTNVTLIDEDGEPRRLGALQVSSSFFDLLGIEPTLGRRLRSEDDRPGASTKALLGQRLFERRFGSDAAILGRTILLDGERIEVVGVLPELPLDADVLPTLATVLFFDLVTSLPLEDPQRTIHGSENYNLLAKLRPDVTLAEIETELLGLAEIFVDEPEGLGAGLTPGSEYRIGVVSLLDQIVGRVRLPLVVLLGATVILLAIACANVANLLLTRAATQRRELAIRAALGAGRRRVLLQSLGEALLLALSGGLLGLSMALGLVRALRWAQPEELPRLASVAIDPMVLLFAAAVCLAASLLFGLGPAVRMTAVAPRDALQETVTAVRASSSWRGSSRRLVIAQVALSLVLTTGAGLLVRTFLHLRSRDPGFRPEGVFSFRLSLTGERYRDPSDRSRFFEELFTRLTARPEVENAGGISMLPLTRGYAWTDFLVEGHEADVERDRTVADVQVVTPGYFEAMGIRLLAGRSFELGDDAEPSVVMVDRSFAERFWPVEEAVGKWIGRSLQNRSRIVGVVENVRHYGLDSEPRLTVFYPHRATGRRTLYGVLSGEGDGAPAVTEVVRAMDPRIPVYDSAPMLVRLSDSLARQRLMMSLLNAFSLSALALATVGLYGVLAYTVASHRHEIAIRKALGAGREDLYRLVFSGAGRLVLAGIGVGAVLSVAASRFLEGLVHGVPTLDPMSFGSAIVVILAIAATAGWLPARRAAAVEPVTALKQD